MKKISVQKKILAETDTAIEEQEQKLQKTESTLSQRVIVIEKQDKIIAEKNAAIVEKHSALEDATMKLADVETLVDEVAKQAYEKACEVVTDTVRQETQREDIKILDDYSRWLSAPERTDDKKLRDYAVRSEPGAHGIQGQDKPGNKKGYGNLKHLLFLRRWHLLFLCTERK